jgi:hypothetical protein
VKGVANASMRWFSRMARTGTVRLASHAQHQPKPSRRPPHEEEHRPRPWGVLAAERRTDRRPGRQRRPGADAGPRRRPGRAATTAHRRKHRSGQAGLDGGLAAAGGPHHPLGRRLVLHLPEVPLDLLQLAPARPTTNVSRGLGAPVPLPRAERADLDAVTFRAAGQDRPHDLGPGLQRQLHRRGGGAAQGPHGVRALRRRAAGGRPAHRAIGHQVVLRPDRADPGGRGQAGRERQGGAVRA